MRKHSSHGKKNVIRQDNTAEKELTPTDIHINEIRLQKNKK